MGEDASVDTIRSAVIKSVFSLSAVTAVLYFIGLVNGQGEADALGLPSTFVKRDLWGTVAYGVEGLLSHTVLLPVWLLRDAGSAVFSILTLLVSLGAIVLVSVIARKSRHALLWISLASIVAVTIHVALSSAREMGGRIGLAIACLESDAAGERCAYSPAQNRVVFEKADEVYERTGVIMSANERFIVLLTGRGYVVLPLSDVKFVETARQ